MPRGSDVFEDKIRRQQKGLGITLEQLKKNLDEDKGSFDQTAKVRGLSITVRVIVRARHALPESWAMSILFNNKRVDGIDWERRVSDHRGKKYDCTGWHRHIWDVRLRDALKECLPEFKPDSLQYFIITGFKILNVQLERSSQDAGKLFDY
jgi:hypothetical protein